MSANSCNFSECLHTENLMHDMASGTDKETGLNRTGLEDYIKVIFPEIPEGHWVHDKPIPDSGRSIRPDYRFEGLKLLIEFDGLQHYQQLDKIRKDRENQTFYESLGYKVIRILHFIQLTNEVVKTMFGREVVEPLFDPSFTSMAISGCNTPAFCCLAGLRRMAEEFRLYPQQYKVNLEFLENQNDDFMTGASLLKAAYEGKS